MDNPARLRSALSEPCGDVEALKALGLIAASTSMQRHQQDQWAAVQRVFETRMQRYPMTVVHAVADEWSERERWFPGSWAEFSERLDAVMAELERLL